MKRLLCLSGLAIVMVMFLSCAPSTANIEKDTPSSMPAMELKTTSKPAIEIENSTSTPTTLQEKSAETIYILLFKEGTARYRVREQLAGIPLPGDAVGVSVEVTGKIVIKPDGTILTEASEFRVDLSALVSNEPLRDTFLRRETLQTDLFPVARFFPVQIHGLPSPLPKQGEWECKIAGDLIIRDVMQKVVWEAKIKVEDIQVSGQAKTNITFSDFNLIKPRVARVLTVEDSIRLEIDFHLQFII